MAESHVIAGLLRKRAEIAGQIEHAHQRLNELIADLDYIDNAIRIIDPNCDATLTKTKPYPPRMGSFRGEMSRFVLGHLRSIKEPATTLEITTRLWKGAAWIKRPAGRDCHPKACWCLSLQTAEERYCTGSSSYW